MEGMAVQSFWERRAEGQRRHPVARAGSQMAFLFADDVNSKELKHDGAKKEIFLKSVNVAA